MIYRFVASVVLLLFQQYALAVSLNGKTNDDEVCDLSPYTTSHLGQIMFVPARTQNIEEIYARIAMRFIVRACRSGQTLILHSDDGSRFEDRYFTNLATRLCGAANIVREPVPTAEEPHAFRIRCDITQLSLAEEWLRGAERERSTELLIVHGAPGTPKENPVRSYGPFTDKPDRCAKNLSYGALIGFGGGCRD